MVYLGQRKPWQNGQMAAPIPRQPYNAEQGVPPMVNRIPMEEVNRYGTPSERGEAAPNNQSWVSPQGPSFKPPGAASYQKLPMPMQQQPGAGPSMTRSGMLTQGGMQPQGNPAEFMQLAQEYLRKNRGM